MQQRSAAAALTHCHARSCADEGGVSCRALSACSALGLSALQPASTPFCLQEEGDNLLDTVTETGIAHLVAFCRNANIAAPNNTGEPWYEAGRHPHRGLLVHCCVLKVLPERQSQVPCCAGGAAHLPEVCRVVLCAVQPTWAVSCCAALCV